MEQQWEEGIIKKLTEQIEWCGVLPYPERPANYFVKHGVGEILVRYENARYSAGDAPQYYQNREVFIELVFVWRRLRGKEEGSQGLYFTVDAVRDALYGYRLPYSSSCIQFIQEDMIGEDKGIWQYGMKFSFKSVYVAPEKESGIPAQTITVTTESHECSASSS